MVQLYADGFESLPLKQKTLIWHLYQAAIAGRDIFIDQKHRDAIAMREIIEPIVAYPKNVDAATLAEIERYTKLFWLNNGPYNNLTARKFVLKITPEALKAAVMAAAKGGARFMTREETMDAKLARLQPMFFDPNVDPIVTNKTPGSRQGHPPGERQQPLLERVDGRPEGLHRKVRTQLAAREAGRQAQGRGLPHQRTVRPLHHRGRQASRSREAVCRTADGQGARRADQVLSHR